MGTGGQAHATPLRGLAFAKKNIKRSMNRWRGMKGRERERKFVKREISEGIEERGGEREGERAIGRERVSGYLLV